MFAQIRKGGVVCARIRHFWDLRNRRSRSLVFAQIPQGVLARERTQLCSYSSLHFLGFAHLRSLVFAQIQQGVLARARTRLRNQSPRQVLGFVY